MKFISLFTRLGLLALGFLLVAILNDDAVWASPSDTAPTTSGLADSLLHEWGFALMVLGILMAMAMRMPRTIRAKPHSWRRESAKPDVVGAVSLGDAQTASSLRMATNRKPRASKPNRVNNEMNFIRNPPRGFVGG